MKTLLVMTGPQGSGNHLWSKVLAETPKVYGWSDLSKTYWIGHASEPFAELWETPELFQTTPFPHDYYVTSISCPYMPKGKFKLFDEAGRVIPKYVEFLEQAKLAGFNIKLVVIGREFNILNLQQKRLRNTVTTPRFIDQLDLLLKYDPVFISTELLYLYRMNYVKQISKLLDFPIEISSESLESILKDNANLKYIKSADAEDVWLDHLMKGK